MAEIVLVRHAPTSWSGRRYCGRSDPPLDAVGRAAAASLATSLADTIASGAVVICSPSRRARATAAAIARACGIADGAIELDPRWREVDFGDVEGRTFDDLARDHPTIAATLASGGTWIDWPNGERAAVFAARVETAWSAVIARAQPVVVVTHAGPIRHVLSLVRGVPPGSVALPEPASALRLDVREPTVVLPSGA